MSTIPFTFSTALYALKDRANLQDGEVSFSETEPGPNLTNLSSVFWFTRLLKILG